MTSSWPSSDLAEWDEPALWNAWIEEGLGGLRAELIIQNADFDEPYGMDDLDAIADALNLQFGRIEQLLAEDADDHVERQVAQAAYGFYLD